MSNGEFFSDSVCVNSNIHTDFGLAQLQGFKTDQNQLRVIIFLT